METLSLPPTVQPWSTVNPRTPRPLLPPPVTLADYPPLPCALRNPRFCLNYNVSTHIVPAAYPRGPAEVWVRPPEVETKAERRHRIQQEVNRLSMKKEMQERGEFDHESREVVMYNVLNRYTRTTSGVKNTGGQQTWGPRLTLILLHCAGTHRETWEPLLNHLFSMADASNTHFLIEEVWSFEAVQHGDSGLINEPHLGDLFDSADNTRDLTSFLLSYLPENVTGNLPTNLSRLSESTAVERKNRGCRNRTLVGVGQSLGSCALVYPAVTMPHLFSSLVFIDSMSVPEYMRAFDAHRNFETACIGRQAVWDNMDDAIKAVKTAGYYKKWAPEALENYYKYGFVQRADGKIRLKLHPYQEAVVIFERAHPYETWELLERIPEHIPMFWMFGGKSERTGTREIQTQTAWRRRANSSNVWLENVGHLMVQQVPQAVADHLFNFLCTSYGPIHKSKL